MRALLLAAALLALAPALPAEPVALPLALGKAGVLQPGERMTVVPRDHPGAVELAYAFGGAPSPGGRPPVEWVWVVCSTWAGPGPCRDLPEEAAWAGSTRVPLTFDLQVGLDVRATAIASYAFEERGLAARPPRCPSAPPLVAFCDAGPFG